MNAESRRRLCLIVRENHALPRANKATTRPVDSQLIATLRLLQGSHKAPTMRPSCDSQRKRRVPSSPYPCLSGSICGCMDLLRLSSGHAPRLARGVSGASMRYCRSAPRPRAQQAPSARHAGKFHDPTACERCCPRGRAHSVPSSLQWWWHWRDALGGLPAVIRGLTLPPGGIDSRKVTPTQKQFFRNLEALKREVLVNRLVTWRSVCIAIAAAACTMGGGGSQLLHAQSGSPSPGEVEIQSPGLASKVVTVEGVFGKVEVDVTRPSLVRLCLGMPKGLGAQSLLATQGLRPWARGGYTYVVAEDGKRYESRLREPEQVKVTRESGRTVLRVLGVKLAGGRRAAGGHGRLDPQRPRRRVAVGVEDRAPVATGLHVHVFRKPGTVLLVQTRADELHHQHDLVRSVADCGERKQAVRLAELARADLGEPRADAARPRHLGDLQAVDHLAHPV